MLKFDTSKQRTNHKNFNLMTSIIAFIIAMIFGTANMNVQEMQQYNNSIKTYDNSSNKGIGWGENGGSVTTPPPPRP
jgi:high-affinity Fe2+/Pb2+ permease